MMIHIQCVAISVWAPSSLRGNGWGSGLYYCLFFFFFQAEDGIRDYKVTGVQTCALPISRLAQARPASRAPAHRRRTGEKWGLQRFMVYIQGLNPRFYELAAAQARHSGIGSGAARRIQHRSEEHTSELQSPCNLVCRLLLEKKKKYN